MTEDWMSELRAMRDEVSETRRQVVEIKDDMGKYQSSINTFKLDVDEALWGAKDDRRKDIEPGLVNLVYQLIEAHKRREAVTSFLKVLITTIGVTNIVVIMVFVIRVLQGAAP